ncbi:MAG TPA: H/ACA RNA-protein complex component Gar1 [Thermoplasmata archaeon]|nr:H/ACA RNA-protein complex component Gar1 [Thermoplasmata archaeon]
MIVGITPSGLLTARAASTPPVPEGSPVTTGSPTLHARVVRVFGPVARPYYSLRPARPVRLTEASRLLGATVLRG